MSDDWMTDEHKAAALEGWLANPVAAAHEGQRPIGLMPDLWPWLQEQVLKDKEDLEELARQRRVDQPIKAWHRSVHDEILQSERPDEAWLAGTRSTGRAPR
jgi:hypothetical protein